MNIPSWIQLGIVAVATVLWPSTVWSEPQGTAENPAVANELRDGLMAALGNSFEYVGGEFGSAVANVNNRREERFWFARVRPMAAGEFAVSYTVKFEFPNNFRVPATESRMYVFPIKIGQRGMPRYVETGRWGGSAYPHANVGDWLVIPIHLDRNGVGHTFTTPVAEDRMLKAYFHVMSAWEREQYVKPAPDKPLVSNQAADWLTLHSGWGESFSSRSSFGPRSHRLTAYLEFKQPGEFNVAGRLADGDKETTDDEASFRVVPRDKPVTVRLEHLYYFEGGWGSARVEGGTIETRVGDRLMMRCGRYSLQASDATQGYRQGTILALPFSAVDPYPPNPTSQAARQDPAKQTDRPNHAVNRSGR